MFYAQSTIAVINYEETKNENQNDNKNKQNNNNNNNNNKKGGGGEADFYVALPCRCMHEMYDIKYMPRWSVLA